MTTSKNLASGAILNAIVAESTHARNHSTLIFKWHVSPCCLETLRIINGYFRIVYWNKPASNFFKLNSDGSLRNGSCGGGGIIKDAQGKMIMAYSIHFNNGTSNSAEAKALLFGIQWCIQHNFTNIELETDSILLLSWVKQIFKIPWQIEGTIRDIRRKLQHGLSNTAIVKLIRYPIC
ncbi:uncharacterized protein LOC132032562 [Lycium ferocissimum]|uniref:uncharacterized protein LOC132032562 n=1 Tax=Lycium ferocissimum TaxID=112874 RepID=UPI0028151AEB|nr:uncharacterized protein LOC132032562 [Lycium ferocissimum]